LDWKIGKERLAAKEESTRIDKYKINPKLIPRYLIIAYHKEIKKNMFSPNSSSQILKSIIKIDRMMYSLINKTTVTNYFDVLKKAKKEIIDYNLHDLDIEHVDWSGLENIKVSFHHNGNLEFREIKGRALIYKCKWYDNGQIESMSYKEDSNRTAKAWNSNGQMIYNQTYRYENFEGEQIWWYDNGQKKLIKNYRNGTLNGPYKQWNEDGVLKIDLNFINGNMVGKLIRIDEFRVESNYDEGYLNGELKWYLLSGEKVLSVNYKKNHLEGSYIIFDEKNKSKLFELIFENNKLSYYYSWYDTGILKETGGLVEKDDLFFKIGEWKYYNRSGNIKNEEDFTTETEVDKKLLLSNVNAHDFFKLKDPNIQNQYFIPKKDKNSNKIYVEFLKYKE